MSRKAASGASPGDMDVVQFSKPECFVAFKTGLIDQGRLVPVRGCTPLSRGLDFYNGCAGAAVELARESKRKHHWMLLDDGVHGALEIADAFAVDDAEFEDALLLAGFDVRQEDVFDFARLDGVQVEDAVYGQRNRVFESFVGVARHQRAAWYSLRSSS